jgi:DNA-binding transcriptional ArsR family regulator/uncharacterized protein YndB with AHSA1/START domain
LTRRSLDPVFRALADPTRRRILDLLHQEPRTTGSLADLVPRLSRFAVMKHLAALERAGLVLVRRQGRARWNHLNLIPLQQIHERWFRPYEAHWAASLISLGRAAEAAAKGAEPMPFTASNPRSMQIEQELTIRAPIEAVWTALTREIGAWWGRPYVHDDARVVALRLETSVGGRFWEDWGAGAGALYATVLSIRAPEELILAGPFGMGGLCQSVVRFGLRAEGGATRLTLSHRAVGEIDAEREAGYQGGWEELLGRRLSGYLERGERLGLGHEPGIEWRAR